MAVHNIIIPIRYPESEECDLIDLASITLSTSIHKPALIEEIMEAYLYYREVGKDRLTAAEIAMNEVVRDNHGGVWEYLGVSVDCIEFI